MKPYYIDLIIFISILYFSLTGYLHGFIRTILDIFTIIAAYLVAFDTYQSFSKIVEKYKVPEEISVIVSFFLIWSAVEIILYFLIQIFYPRIPKEVRQSKINKFLGIIPSALKGLTVIAVFLLILTTLPLSSALKEGVNKSVLGKPLLNKVKFLEKYVQNVFKEALKQAEFKIIKPGSDEEIDLDYKISTTTVDEESEEKMLKLVNDERLKQGLGALVMDKKIQEVARKHSKDMFAKGYFAHQNKEGLSPFDRLDAGGVKYKTAGENLALAPDVYMAHKGLMESPGHRANILTADFKKIGIGVIDGGKYGKMFTQNFSD